jgi:aryl-alcohol dehydrogenase-like predicted oxidoreductase
MKYGNVAGIDKRISRVLQGTVYFSPERQDEAFAVFDAAFESGCNSYDTAHGYGKGACEKVLGQWIKARGVREEVVILDKGAHPYDGKVRVTPEDITSDITDSLQRLEVDFIDLYILHRDDETKPVGPIVEVLNEHHKAGRIHAFGGSNWRWERIQEANEYAAAHGLVPFAASSPQYSLAEMVQPAWDGCIGIGGEGGRAARDWYQQNQMPLFTWSSLAGGFMTGKFRRDNLNSFSEYFDTTTMKAYCYEDNFRRLDRAEQLAQEKGVSITELALAYILNQPLNVFAITGSRLPQEFKANVAGVDLELSPAELAWLDLQTEELVS